MISSSRQLKDKVRNISDGNSKKATTLIRNFMMERFLERVSISSYRDNFILKGGMLVASIVGVDMRATMDIDTTVKALPLNEADVQRIIEEICNIPLEDNVSFQIKSTRTIMEEFDYPGIRVMLEATLDRMRQPIKIDISTDDVITPKAVEYDYKLMFEDRTMRKVSDLFGKNVSVTTSKAAVDALFAQNNGTEAYSLFGKILALCGAGWLLI